MPSSSPSRSEDDGGHSLLSPSASKRWLSCRASVGFIQRHRDQIPPETTESEYAKEGTAAHLFAQRLLMGEKRLERPRSSEMIACIEEGYVPFVQEEARKVGVRRMVPEQRVALFYDRSQQGTCDVPLLGKERIAIVDLKYGAGISVEAKFNTQLAIYGESAIQEHEKKHGRYPPDTPVELVIYQPRAQDNRFVRRWPLTRGELAQFCKPILDTAHSIIMDPDDQPFQADADTICRFCPAKAFCSHYAAHLLEELPAEVAKPLKSVEMRLHLPSPGKMSDSQLIKLLRVRDDLVAWFDEIEEHMTNRAIKGHKYEGLKVVEGRSNRRWKDEKEAKRLLRKIFTEEEIMDLSFKSPAAIGDMIKELRKKPSASLLDSINKLIVKPPGKPRLAVRDDPAQALVTSELL